MTTQAAFLTNNGASGVHMVVAHGAGAPADSPFLELFAAGLAEGPDGLTVQRFEFAYMAGRREGKAKRPPPKMDALTDEYREAVMRLRTTVAADARILIGGKSMGGRVASLIADELFAAGQISGLVCAGYPFHPQGKADQLRVSHLGELKCPTLILQGERDAFGNRDEVERYALSPLIEVAWITDGDHDFGPRGKSGATKRGNITEAATLVQRFAAKVAR